MTDDGPGGLSRRRFVAAAVAAAAGGAGTLAACSGGPSSGTSEGASTRAPVTTRARPDEGARRRVVVIGAGLAGLTAALDLVEAGWGVVVLEARERVGGRVLTLGAPFTDGIHVEAGGESIDDDHRDIQALVRRFGLRTERRPEDKETGGVVHLGGRRRAMGAFLEERDGRVLADYLRCTEALDDLGAGIDPEHPERADAANDLDARTLAELITELDLVPEAEALVRAEQRSELNAEPEDVSLLFVAQQSAVGAASRDDGVETMRIAGGNSRLVEAMARELGDRVVLGAAVERIAWDGDGVRVGVTGGRTHDGARLVVACPFVPLRSVAFDPPLPPSLAGAVAGLDLGAAAKVATQFDERFWTASGGTGFVVTDLPFGIAWEATDSSAAGRTDPGVLSQLITGTAARDAAALDDEERIARFQGQLDEVLPEGADLRSGPAATMAWARERWTGGGYAVWQPGQLSRWWAPMREGVGPIRFAGEHTEALAGYMESAVRSGHRVAAELGPPPPA